MKVNLDKVIMMYAGFFTRYFLIFLMFSCFSAKAIDLPSPYRVPNTPFEGVDVCASCGSKNIAGMPRQGGYIETASGNLRQNITLLASPFIDVGGLLTVMLGEPLEFRPGEYFALIPPGADIYTDYLLFREGKNKTGFRARNSSMWDMDMTSADAPWLKLFRENNFIVIRNHRKSQDYVFEENPFSELWRLKEIRRLDAPELKLECFYSPKTGGLEKISLPGSESLVFEYDKMGNIGTVRKTDGEDYTKLEYDTNGFIRSVSSFLTSRHPFFPQSARNTTLSNRKKDFLFREIIAEHDIGGRLLQVADGNGIRHAAEYRTDENPRKKTAEYSTIHILPSGEKKIYKKFHDFKENIIILTEGRLRKKAGDKGAEMEEIILQESVLKKIVHTYRVVSRTRNGKKTDFSYKQENTTQAERHERGKTPEQTQYNELGLLTELIHSEGIRKYEYNDRGQLIVAEDESGKCEKYHYSETGKLLSFEGNQGGNYQVEYHSDGTPSKIICANGDIYSCEWDEHLRLTKLDRNDGFSYEWKYKGSFRFPVETTEHFTSRNNEPIPNRTIRYAYDPAGRLTGKLYPDGTFETWKYNCCNITEYRNRQKKVTKLYYNQANQMIRHFDEDTGLSQIFYDDEGRIQKIIYPDGKTGLWCYDAMGRLISETDKNGLQTTRTFSPDGKLLRENYPDGQYREWQYDEAGKLQSCRGKDNYILVYDEVGKYLGRRNFSDSSLTGESTYDDERPSVHFSGEVWNEAEKHPLFQEHKDFFTSQRIVREDGLIEQKSLDNGYIYINIRKNDVGVISSHVIPFEEYMAMIDIHKRETHLALHETSRSVFSIWDQGFEYYVNGKIEKRTYYTQLGAREESFEYKDGILMRHLIYGRKYSPGKNIISVEPVKTKIFKRTENRK